VKFARVIGTVVSTQKYEGLEGVKFLVVQPLDEDLSPKGRPVVAADATQQAGPGELVFVVGSREAAQALPEVFVPVDLAITGIIDEVDRGDQSRRGQPTARWYGPAGRSPRGLAPAPREGRGVQSPRGRRPGRGAEG
jgi:ethanolamine utilization protein EutN